jgi:hypothetical protein
VHGRQLGPAVGSLPATAEGPVRPRGHTVAGMPRSGTRQRLPIPATPIPAESAPVRSRPGGVPSPHPGAACGHGPRRGRPGQGPPQAVPEGRAASLTRTASGAVSAGWPRQRPVRGRVQGPGRGAEGEAVACLVSSPGEVGLRHVSADRVRAAGCCCLVLSVQLVGWGVAALVLLAPGECWFLLGGGAGSAAGGCRAVSLPVSARRLAWATPRPWPDAGAKRW